MYFFSQGKASDHQRRQGKKTLKKRKTGVTRPCPDGGVIKFKENEDLLLNVEPRCKVYTKR